MNAALFGRVCAWCTNAPVGVIFIGWSPIADMPHIQIERAALPRDFSLGKMVAIVSGRTNTWPKPGEARLFSAVSTEQLAPTAVTAGGSGCRRSWWGGGQTQKRGGGGPFFFFIRFSKNGGRFAPQGGGATGGDEPVLGPAHLVSGEVQDSEIKLPRALQKRKMARIRQDQQPRVRNRPRDIVGVLASDRLVMIAVDDEDRRVDRLELRIAPVRLFCPHLAYLTDKGIILFGRRRLPFIFVAGAFNVGGKGRVLLYAFLDARGRGVGRKCENLADPFLVAHGEIDTDNASVAPSHDIGLGEFEIIHQRNDVVGH